MAQKPDHKTPDAHESHEMWTPNTPSTDPTEVESGITIHQPESLNGIFQCPHLIEQPADTHKADSTVHPSEPDYNM